MRLHLLQSMLRGRGMEGEESDYSEDYDEFYEEEHSRNR